MEIGHQQIDRAEPVARQNEQRRLAGEWLKRAVVGSRRVSNRRRLVVPTATTRPPLRRAALIAVRGAAVISPRSACM